MAKRRRHRKHIPQRTCVACRTTGSKRDFIRIVRTPEGTIEIDETGKKNGRGAYLCRKKVCWEKALEQGILQRALRTQISADVEEQLRAFLDDLPPSTSENETD